MSSPHTQHGRSGFTLVELMLSLAISGLVAMGVVMMLAGVASATAEEQDSRDSLITRQVVAERLEAIMSPGSRVLSESGGAIVLWLGESTGDGKPTLSELRRLDWDSGAGEVTVYEAPSTINPSDDAAYEFTDDFEAITSGLAGSALMPGSVLLEAVTAWSVALDDATVQNASLARVEVTNSGDAGDDTQIVIVAMRSNP